MSALRIPDVTGLDTLAAALAYAEAGWYVGPVKARTKNPGSVLGASWHERTSRDPKQLAAWFAGTDHGLFLHVGRSGAVVLDVDAPGKLHEAIGRAVDDVAPPFQGTRPDVPGRGHYLFGCPPGATFGNGVGALGGGWGEVRGRNGVIVVAPSVHTAPGGRYRWHRIGPVPGLPAYLADQLPDALDAAGSATDGQVAKFLAEHRDGTRPDLLELQVCSFDKSVRAGESRHQSMTGHLAGAMKESAAGFYDAQLAADTLESVFLAAVARAGTGRQGAARTGRVAALEWGGLLAWAVAQAIAADPDATRARSDATMPRLTLIDGPAPEPCTLREVHDTFARWLGREYDLGALDVVLCVAAAEQLPGDPPWLLVVSGSGAAKTETVWPLAGAGAFVTSTITSEGALLSATSKRERTKNATGGLLRKIGDHGLLVIKDVTSILSMQRDARSAVLAAMREIHDGKWERNVGSDGGQTLTWTGRLVVIGAVTTKWDKAHEVVSSMGDRFVLVRLDSTVGRIASGRQAIGNAGTEEVMRAELAGVVGGLLATVDTSADLTLTREESETILALADVVTLARTAVEHDYAGNVLDSYAPEMPTRYAKQLAQIMRGGLALGMDRGRLLHLVTRCARDSIPPLRLLVLLDIAENPASSTSEVRSRVDKPRATVDRTLQALHILGLLRLDEPALSGAGWRYSVAAGVDAATVDTLATVSRVDLDRASPEMST